MPLKEYKPGSEFPGVIARAVEKSEPARPRPLRARPNAPNVRFIVLDDWSGYLPEPGPDFQPARANRSISLNFSAVDRELHPSDWLDAELSVHA